MITFKCLNCGKEVTRKYNNDKYCNNKCQREHQFKIDYKNRTKLCTTCNEIKSFDDFSPRNKKGDNLTACKKCAAEVMGEYRNKNREKVNKQKRDRRKADPEKYKEIDRKRRLDPKRKLGENVSRGIRHRIKKNGKSSFGEILPYTKEDLIERLKETIPEGFTWDDYMKKDLFNIDHIIPQSIYNFKEFYHLCVQSSLEISMTRLSVEEVFLFG
jgi:hypothetical protein